MQIMGFLKAKFIFILICLLYVFPWVQFIRQDLLDINKPSPLINSQAWFPHCHLFLFASVISGNWFICILSSFKGRKLSYFCHSSCGTNTPAFSLGVIPPWGPHSSTRNILGFFYKFKYSAVIFTETFCIKLFCVLKYTLGIDDGNRWTFLFLMCLLGKIKSQYHSIQYHFITI